MLALLLILAPEVEALDDNSAVPVLLYHSGTAGPGCNADDTDVLAFARDIEILRQRGYTIVPLLNVVQWRLGIVAGSALPERVATISFDDGHDRDWLNSVPSKLRHPNSNCPNLPSVRAVSREYQVPVTFFVIASRVARAQINPDHLNDNWWQSAQKNPLFDIGNHSADHEHQRITTATYDPEMGAEVPVAGLADGVWQGQSNPLRWTNYATASVEVQAAAEIIESHTEVWPVLFAHPFGIVSPYVHDTYLPQYQAQHGTLAAFCTEAGTSERLVRKSSDRWCLPRIGHGVSWVTGDDLNRMIDGWER